MEIFTSLISCAELDVLINNTSLKNVKIFDASYGPSAHTNNRSIAEAQRFDIDEIADLENSLAHTLPNKDVFEQKMRQLGVSNEDQIIIYDKTGVAMSACRAWWMFRIFGHENVAVLNGGFPAWEKGNYPIDDIDNTVSTEKSTFSAVFDAGLIRGAKDILENIETQNDIVIDARDVERFAGLIADPRANNTAGRIPNSLNLPFQYLLDQNTRLFLSDDKLKEIVEAQEINMDSSLVVSCGSGVTACVVALALYRLGKKDVAIYDGSWTEWGLLDMPRTQSA